MSRTALAISDNGAAAEDADTQATAKRLDSGRSIGSDDTASTDPSSTETYDDQYDPYNKGSGTNTSGGASVKAPPANPWAPKTARYSSAKKNSTTSSVTRTTTRLRRSRSDEDLERVESFVQKAEKEHGLATGQGGSARNAKSSSSATTAKATSSRGDGAFDDDLQAMMDGVEERRRARREAATRVDDAEAEAKNGSTGASRGRLASRRCDDIGTQKMARRRSSSAPPGGSNRSLFSDDETYDDDMVHSDGDYRKTIRWTDHHGSSLEDVCILDPAMSEGGMRRAEKLRSMYGDDDDYLEEDEEAQYDSDETPSSDEDGEDYVVGDDGNDSDGGQHAEVSMLVFDTQFIESGDVDLDRADTSLSLMDAMAAFSSPSFGSNPGRTTSRNDDSTTKGGASRRSRRPKRDQVQEGSFTLDDLTDVQAIAMAVTDGEPDAGASASCFGEVSMDLSEISAEMNDELNDLQPIANKPKKAMPSITEDSMNVFPDLELVTSKDKAINASVSGDDRNTLPVPTSVIMQPLVPARKKRSSFTTSPTSSPSAAKAILATKPIDVLDGGNDSFADFASWGNDSFDANTSSSYKTTKKQHHHQQHKMANTKKESRSPATAKPTSTPVRPAAKPNRPPGTTSNNNTAPASMACGRPRKGPPPPQGRQLRPPGSKGPTPPSRQKSQQQRQQQGRRSSSDNREGPRRSSSTNSDTARKAAAAVAASSSASRSNSSSSGTTKPSKGKSMLGGLFTRNSQTSKQSKKLHEVGDEEVGILGHVDSSLGDSLNSLGDLAGLDSYFDPPAASSRLAGGNPNTGTNLAASIARNSQRQQQQRRRNNMKGRSLDDSDAALFAHIDDGEKSRQSRRDSLDDLFVKDKW